MKKRILLVMIGLTLVFALTACVPDPTSGTNDLKQKQPATQTENTPVNDVQTPDESVEAPANDTPTNNATNPESQPTTTPSETQQTYTSNLTAEQAKKIAFDHAGVLSGDVYDLELEFDRDDGIASYEIEFKSARIEYEYDIHAETGEILKAEKDGKDNRNQTTETPSRKTSDEAKKIAFDHAGVTAERVYDLELELDGDDGVLSYEIEFKSDRTEYKYDIHAETGEILKAEKDYDD